MHMRPVCSSGTSTCTGIPCREEGYHRSRPENLEGSQDSRYEERKAHIERPYVSADLQASSATGTREVILCVDDLGRSTPQAGPGSMADRGARPTVQVNTGPAPRIPHGAGCASEDERGKQTVNSIYDR